MRKSPAKAKSEDSPAYISTIAHTAMPGGGCAARWSEIHPFRFPLNPMRVKYVAGNEFQLNESTKSPHLCARFVITWPAPGHKLGE